METSDQTAPPSSLRKRFYFTLAGALLTLAAFETVLHAATWISPRVAAVLDRHAGLLIPDARLIHRPNPAYPDHDHRGFRNDSVPGNVFAVALGDSQTYGAMVSRENAWPQQLERLARKPVYNMAFGGYGAGEALELIEDALALDPEWVLFGLYSGNDLFDAYELAYKHDTLAGMRSPDEAVRTAIAEAETGGSIESAFRETFSVSSAIKQWVGDYSKVYGLARAVRNRVRGSAWQESEPEWATIALQEAAHPEWFLVRDTESPTVLNARYRLLALDRADTRILEGERITFEALVAIADRCAKANVRFAVVALPTKELVYENLALGLAHGDAGPELEQLWRDETAFWRACKAHCDANGIPFIDTREPLIKALRRGSRPFRRDADGHLTVEGNRIVSEAVLPQIEPR